MRVIAGKYKGRILKMPGGLRVRPTSQKVKEALFDVLGEKIYGASFLELYAGGGNVGIEAKSRGAARVFFVENNRTCIKTIERNLTRLKVLYNYGLKLSGVEKETAVVLLPMDAERAIELLYQKDEKFDFIFLDPPYYQAQLKNTLIKICHCDILNPRSYVIAEHNKRQVLSQRLLRLRLVFSKKYGDTCLSFYQKEI